LKELRRRRLEGREQAELLEGLRCQILGLGEDQDRALSGPVPLDQEGVERDEALGWRVAGLRNAEVLEDVLEQSIEGQRRVEHQSRGSSAIEAAEKGAQQRGLARPNLAGQQNEPA